MSRHIQLNPLIRGVEFDLSGVDIVPRTCHPLHHTKLADVAQPDTNPFAECLEQYRMIGMQHFLNGLQWHIGALTHGLFDISTVETFFFHHLLSAFAASLVAVTRPFMS